jgi:hypothetical protein
MESLHAYCLYLKRVFPFIASQLDCLKTKQENLNIQYALCWSTISLQNIFSPNKLTSLKNKAYFVKKCVYLKSKFDTWMIFFILKKCLASICASVNSVVPLTYMNFDLTLGETCTEEINLNFVLNFMSLMTQFPWNTFGLIFVFKERIFV